MNKVILGDCLEEMQKLIDEGIKVDCIVTDPPYKIISGGVTGGVMSENLIFSSNLGKKGKVFKHNDIEIKDYINFLYEILHEKGHCYIMTNQHNLYNFLKVIHESKFNYIKSLIWEKNKIINQVYMSSFEFILFMRKGKHKKINNCGTSDILKYPNKKTKINNKNIHDTEKPVNLMKVLIENSSKENDVILDPFAGSGTTAIACLKTRRKYICIEKDPKYYEIMKQRIEEENKRKYEQIELF